MSKLIEKIVFIPARYFTVETAEDGTEEKSEVWQLFPDAVKIGDYYARAYLDRDEEVIREKLIEIGVFNFEFKSQEEAILFSNELNPQEETV